MSVPADYEWPGREFIKPPLFRDFYDANLNRRLFLKIESFFEDKFNATARLFPSGRSALSCLFKFFRMNRSHIVFAPKWSSECLWSVIGRKSNPTTSFCCGPDYVIAVHKWGFQTQLSKSYPNIMIEDSVDSLFNKADSLFALGSEFDLVSLPKVIGSFSGAILFSKNKLFLDFLEEQRRTSDVEISIRQSRMKHEYFSGRGVYPHEHENIQMETNELLHVEACLKNYEINLEVIQSRIEKISRRFQRNFFANQANRYPSNLPVPENMFTVKDKEAFLMKHFDVRCQLDKPVFEPCYILPLHMGVEENFFDFLLGQFEI